MNLRVERPRRFLALAAGFGLIAGATGIMASSIASATTGGTEVDLTTSTDIEPLGGGLITFSEFDSSTGTGVFESFVRVQATGTERGFNTDGNLRFDELQSSNFTRSLLLEAVPIVNTVRSWFGARSRSK